MVSHFSFNFRNAGHWDISINHIGRSAVIRGEPGKVSLSDDHSFDHDVHKIPKFGLRLFRTVADAMSHVTSIYAGESGLHSALSIMDRYSRNDELRLMCGEMTAQELRTVKAVLAAIRSQIQIAHHAMPPETEL